MPRISDPQHFDQNGNPVVLPGQVIGTLCGRDVYTIQHTILPDLPVPVGSLLIGCQPVRRPDGTVGEIRHIFQLYEIRHASEGRGEYLLMQARQQDVYRSLAVHDAEANRFLQGLEATMDEMVFAEGTSHNLGYLDLDGNFHPPSILPPINIQIRMPTEDDLRLLEPLLGDMKIGWVLIGKTPSRIQAGFFHKFMPYHTFISAATGWGKTEALKNAVHSCAESGRYGGIICDGQGDIIQSLLSSPLAPEKYVFFSNDPQYASNPLVRRWKISAHQVRPQHIAEIYRLTDAQRLALPILKRTFEDLRQRVLASEEAFQRYLDSAAQSGDEFGLGWSWLTFVAETSRETLRTLPTARGINEMTLDALKVRFESLKNFRMLTDNSQECRLETMYTLMEEGKIVIVDTTDLFEEEVRLFIAMIGGKMLYEREQLRKRLPLAEFERLPTLVLFLDEAHEYLSDDSTGGASSTCTLIAKTGRKFKVTIFGASQQPSDISRKIRSQFNNLLLGPQPLELDREASVSMASHPVAHLKDLLQVGAQGEGILSARGLPFAVPIKVFSYDARIEEYRRRQGIDQRIATRRRSQVDGFAG